MHDNFDSIVPRYMHISYPMYAKYIICIFHIRMAYITHLLMAGFIGIACFAEIGDKIEYSFSHTHILTAKVLAKIRHAHDKRQSKDVGQILTAYAAQTLDAEMVTYMIEWRKISYKIN